MSLSAITLRDLISEARSVPTFTGQDAYSLKSFIEEVEALVRLTTDEEGRNYIYRILYSKIQGPAAAAVRRIQLKKGQLKTTFGVQKSYLKLKEEADSTTCKNVSDLYTKLNSILNLLNLKYDLDDSKPVEFSPSNNEISIVEKFLNKIDRVDSMFLRTKSVKSLEQAYRSLLETNISDSRIPGNNFSYRNNSNTNFRNNHNSNFRNNNTNSRNNHRNTNRPFNNNNYNNNIRNTYTNRPIGKNYTANENFRNFRPNQQFDNTSNNPPGPSYNKNRSIPVPMDVDSHSTENFHCGPLVRHYP
ncbi:putative uncharacterized protein DDB_G0277255 [Condylostylus longicornis]|uniref:putative uncharacterized protein DDB_G0277255 n=1 Tax=Condylostylus longicornis TaxID=2530218 RepID=UPI00244E12D0|nr:putative uncharacterized protein DDB_G0277255 [Condylostylus longicornis]